MTTSTTHVTTKTFVVFLIDDTLFLLCHVPMNWGRWVTAFAGMTPRVSQLFLRKQESISLIILRLDKVKLNNPNNFLALLGLVIPLLRKKSRNQITF